MLKPWCIEHIIHLIIAIVVSSTTAIILKIKLKNDKQIEIMFRILGIIGNCIINRKK